MGAAEVRVAEAGVVEVGAAEMGVVEVGGTEIGAAEVGVDQSLVVLGRERTLARLGAARERL